MITLAELLKLPSRNYLMAQFTVKYVVHPERSPAIVSEASTTMAPVDGQARQMHCQVTDRCYGFSLDDL
jgi:hypothetical protein